MVDSHNNKRKQTFLDKIAKIPLFHWLKTGLEQEGIDSREELKRKIDAKGALPESHPPEAMKEQHNQEATQNHNIQEPEGTTSPEDQPHHSQEKEDKEN